MFIELYDESKKEDVKLKLKNEKVIPAQDLFVVFIGKDTICGLENGKDSAPYNEYLLKKINHIISAQTEYRGLKYELTIGYFLSESHFVPFLINQTSDEYGHIFFSDASYSDERCYTLFKIFNYSEYSTLQDLGFEKFTFQEFITQLIEKDIDINDYKLYGIPGIENRLATNAELMTFLDEQENTKI